MYEPMIKTIYGQMQTQLEGDILRAVQSYGIDVNKEELLKALQYDRDQYEKGYDDGKADAQKWISVTERLPEDGVLVLCIGARGGMFLGRSPSLFSDRTCYFAVPNARSCRYGTHWMPLPETPTGE